MKRFVMTVALACTISGSAIAGDVPSVDLKSTTPDEATPRTTPTAPGEIPSVGYTSNALNLIQMMVGLVL